MADLAILNQREREMIIMPKLTLKMLRAGTEMTQAEVAEKLEISPATWSKWENGKSFPNVVEIKKLKNCLISVIPILNFYQTTRFNRVRQEEDKDERTNQSNSAK